ncbi:MAG: hypothetical protein II488_01960, partial [Firmicutes bacterium]|nr:hypothetical protein [Bacillota bacterium]
PSVPRNNTKSTKIAPGAEEKSSGGFYIVGRIFQIGACALSPRRIDGGSFYVRHPKTYKQSQKSVVVRTSFWRLLQLYFDNKIYENNACIWNKRVVFYLAY